jgi:hypothetical protein
MICSITELGRCGTQAVKAWVRQWTSNLILYMFVYARQYKCCLYQTSRLVYSFRLLLFAWRRILYQPRACRHHYTVVDLFSSCLMSHQK